MIHFEYDRFTSFNVVENISFSFDYNEETRLMENWECTSYILPMKLDADGIYNINGTINPERVFPTRSLRQFCSPKNIEELLSFETPESDFIVIDGTSYTLTIKMSDGREITFSEDDETIKLNPYVKKFENYAKKIRRGY